VPLSNVNLRAVRLGELSARSGVPRSTIKFYIREGMLPGGEVHAPNQASYGSQHLERLELIRALREVAGLSIEVIARVTAELDRGWEEGADPISEALSAIYAPPPRERSRDEQARLAGLAAEVTRFLRGLDWTTEGDERHYYADEIASALLDVRRYLFPEYPVAALAPLARIAWLLSEVEFAQAPGGARVPLRARGDDVAEPTRRAILGTVLFERIFAALRRCANSMRSVRISEGREVPPAAYVRADEPAARTPAAKRRRPSARGARGARSVRKRRP
jgi:DNA-binding transcriptional MerR regulator